MKGHPWAYREAFQHIPGDLRTGAEVGVETHKGLLLGSGYVDIESAILVRMVEGDLDKPPSQNIGERIRTAIRLRQTFFDTAQTNAFRVSNGEGDGLPGLIIDKYSDAVSLQLYSLGLEPFLDIIVDSVKNSFPDIRWIYRRNQVKLTSAQSAGLIWGKNLPEKIKFIENGLSFQTDLQKGQKTGFFLDQRDNRRLIREFSRGKKVANICGYTGAFTVAALAGGARETVTVDSAEPALREVNENLRLNGLSKEKNESIKSDMFRFLETTQKGAFDLIILDPPSMAKGRKDLPQARSAYRRLNTLGFEKISSGGLLFTASCTSHVTRDDFLEIIADSAQRARRRARIIKETHHAVDHPVALAHIEGRYLKGLLLEVI